MSFLWEVSRSCALVLTVHDLVLSAGEDVTEEYLPFRIFRPMHKYHANSISYPVRLWFIKNQLQHFLGFDWIYEMVSKYAKELVLDYAPSSLE